jgi:hypothetical protein
VHLTHARGADVVAVASADMLGGFGTLTLCGTKGRAQAAFSDTHFAFKSQLQAFVDFLRSGVHSFPFAETEELMRLVIGGIESRRQGGREIPVTAP